MSCRCFTLCVNIYVCLRSNHPPALPHNKLSQRRYSLHTKDNLDKPADSSIQGITGTLSLSPYTGNFLLFLTAGNSLNHYLPSLSAALDGVPFSLHPKFDIPANGTVRRDISNNTEVTDSTACFLTPFSSCFVTFVSPCHISLRL